MAMVMTMDDENEEDENEDKDILPLPPALQLCARRVPKSIFIPNKKKD